MNDGTWMQTNIYLTPDINLSAVKGRHHCCDLTPAPLCLCKPLSVSRLHSETGRKVWVTTIHNACPRSSGPPHRYPCNPWEKSAQLTMTLQGCPYLFHEHHSVFTSPDFPTITHSPILSQLLSIAFVELFDTTAVQTHWSSVFLFL